MTDITEVAKKFGAYVSEVNGKVNFAPEQLQTFADHYRKECAEELLMKVETAIADELGPDGYRAFQIVRRMASELRAKGDK